MSTGLLLLCASATQAEAHNCQCRNRGAMYELGQTSCLHVDGGSYLARCEMKLNVSSWTRIGDTCPISRADPNSPRLLLTN
jgi:hypothetical protein